MEGIKIYLKDYIRMEEGNFKEIMKMCVVPSSFDKVLKEEFSSERNRQTVCKQTLRRVQSGQSVRDGR